MHWKGYPVANQSWVDHKDLNTLELLKEYYSHSVMAGQPTV